MKKILSIIAITASLMFVGCSTSSDTADNKACCKGKTESCCVNKEACATCEHCKNGDKESCKVASEKGEAKACCKEKVANGEKACCKKEA
ncbi:hypothetical protein [Flammeovirga kamogawensis]|uniref:Uncharacterized protein n=1 Tax=Flammeovirga kamogawensis TaxID=373891 RepID=A0ABX8GXZ9_9BACT|nr:hypothetical protein [Flammeovirga kamogawensis]MBB6460920.1 protein involved in sex pheromone biosynthesis [Flammeovirga kamogawensis]QWG08264.1 hypothetical protein KM029_04820 [Flammeovirga kamogawensis]TRX70067.1 hypothetical protein EO216_18755 [Flammeovirga kamogawensis]